MVGIAVYPPSTADEDDAAEERVDPGLVDKMDAVSKRALDSAFRSSVRRYADR